MCAGDSSRDLALLLSIAAERRVASGEQQEREEAVRMTENKGQIGGEPLRPGPERSRRSTTRSATRSSCQWCYRKQLPVVLQEVVASDWLVARRERRQEAELEEKYDEFEKNYDDEVLDDIE